jgi:hypothetical protein
VCWRYLCDFQAAAHTSSGAGEQRPHAGEGSYGYDSWPRLRLLPPAVRLLPFIFCREIAPEPVRGHHRHLLRSSAISFSPPEPQHAQGGQHRHHLPARSSDLRGGEAGLYLNKRFSRSGLTEWSVSSFLSGLQQRHPKLISDLSSVNYRRSPITCEKLMGLFNQGLGTNTSYQFAFKMDDPATGCGTSRQQHYLAGHP